MTNQGLEHSLVTCNALAAGVSYASIQMPLISTKPCSTTSTTNAPIISAICSSAVETSSSKSASIFATSTAMTTSLFTASSTITTSAGNTSSAVTGPTVMVVIV